MIKAARRVLSMSSADRRHLARCLLVVAAVRAALSTRGANVVLQRMEEGVGAAPLPVIRRTAWGVTAAARLVPGATCLTQALAAKYLLAREGYASELEIGVKPGSGAAFEAHAWLLCGGLIVTGGASEDLARFKPLTRLHAARR